MNKLKITILVDNHAQEGLTSEHGFSALIEINDQRILFDTGQQEVLFRNAKKLGVDLTNLNSLILSHGHYDHTGETAEILKLNPACELYLHPKAMLPRFSIREGISKNIAISTKNQQAILNHPINQLHWVTSATEITDSLSLTGEIPKTTTFENSSGPFFLDTEGKRVDPISDDQSIWIETKDGLIILTGCCHAGIINTMDYIKQKSGVTKVRAIIGGFHLRSASKEKQKQTVSALKNHDIKELVPCHCTGDETTAYLKKGLNIKVTPGIAGLILTFN